MTHHQFSRPYTYFVFCCCVLLASCGSNLTQESSDTQVNSSTAVTSTVQNIEEDNITPQIITNTPTIRATIQQIAANTPVSAIEISETPFTTATPIPSATVPPTLTSPPTPSLTELAPACEESDALPDKALPRNVDIASSHIVVDYPYMYLAAEQYIGVFDISDPVYPQFLGFWEFPDLSKIVSLKVHNGIAYVVSDSTVHMMNLSTQCRFTPIATIELSSTPWGIHIEGDRLYLGEYSGEGEEDQSQVNIFSIAVPSQPTKLGVVDLGQNALLWSVSEGSIYSLKDDKLFVSDVSNPQIVHTEPLNVVPDSGILSRSLGGKLTNGSLYVFSNADGLLIISDLQEESPIVKHNPRVYPQVHIFQVQEDYVFLGDNSCDGIDCGSVAYIMDAETGEELSYFGLSPHYPVFKYQEIQDDLIYAFTPNTMLVIDISNLANPVIIGQIPLIT